ncbi:404_t:CDS:2 [Acaulospora colombiana]|uniref:404_t:CDS:1 n=1 Tax=Acaulospora colombiana TaxID=27376 RepID=A0ACA9L6N8_9GLOM|nr:404_t:CDS:2 [Acaulospora colombiana]
MASLSNETPLILYHYAGSPFSMKIIWALTIKGLPWNSVTVPLTLPRPSLQLLTHGYRRIPVLQCGSDVFVDTSLILEELERRKGSDKSDKGLAKSMIMWTDRYFFSASIQSSLVSTDPSTPKFLTTSNFLSDRSSLMGRPFNLQKLRSDRPQIIDQIRSNLEWIEQQLDDDREWFLDTLTPGIADIHVATNLFLLGFTRSANELSIAQNYPKTYAWFNRFGKYIKESEKPPVNMTEEEALEIARKYKPLSARDAQLEDKMDLYRKVGDRVSIQPDDYGKVPVVGKIVSLGNSHVAIRPNNIDKTGIEVVVWFPRAGYDIIPINNNQVSGRL